MRCAVACCGSRESGSASSRASRSTTRTTPSACSRPSWRSKGSIQQPRHAGADGRQRDRQGQERRPDPQGVRERPVKFETPAMRAARRVYPKYQRALANANAMDFGDLLLWALELLKHHPDAHKRFARRFRYVLVDEFQDTNRVQLRVASAAGGRAQQSGRGRRRRPIDLSVARRRRDQHLGLNQQYPGAKVHQARGELPVDGQHPHRRQLRHSPKPTSHDKTLRTRPAPGEAVAVTMLETGEDEGTVVAQTITSLIT